MKKLLALTAVATVAVPSISLAATTTSTIAVGATVLESCVAVASPLAFGNYSGDELDAQTTVAVTCTNGTGWSVALDGGGASDIANRLLSLTDDLPYQLYTDSGRTTVFGDGTTGDEVTGTGNGLPQTVDVFGRIEADEFPAAGVYADTVTVTVTY